MAPTRTASVLLKHRHDERAAAAAADDAETDTIRWLAPERRHAPPAVSRNVRRGCAIWMSLLRQNNSFKPRDNTRPGPAALTAPKPPVGLPAASNRTVVLMPVKFG